MNYDIIIKKLNEMLIDKSKGIDVNYEFSDDTNLIEDLNFDSLQMIELMVNIENQFDIEIDEEELVIENFIYYGQLKKFLYNKTFSV